MVCPGRATLGSGYENLVGSQKAAASFTRLLDSHTAKAKAAALPPRPPPLEKGATALARRSACPPPRVLLLHRGAGASSPRRIVNVDAVR